MKIAQDNEKVELGEAISAPRTFMIASSKEAFKMLSAGLYNDRKTAIIRELSCNAFDAHVAAGKKDVPFEVHLPTTFEPYFSVKDYGIGLEHGEYPSAENGLIGKGVLGLYCTYFATNKSASNEFVGALGLGSKSPFCYNEGKSGFTVTSRYQNVTRIYSAYIDDQGMPTILEQSKEDTPNEPNGLEVSFPVKSSDCWEFSNAAEKVFEFFEPTPIINTEIDIKKCQYSIKTETWGLRKNDEYGKPRAIQGMVPYSVGNIDKSKLTSEQISLLDLPIDIFFPIGELSVAASRETLSNDDRTIKNILKAIEGINKSVINQLKEKLALCNSAWQARLEIFKMINNRGFGGVINNAYNTGQFDGIYPKYKLQHGAKAVINELDYTATTITKFKKNWRSTTAYKDKVFNRNDEERKQAFASIETKLRTKEAFDQAIEVSDEVMFVINDLGFGIEKYIHYFLQQANDNQDRKVVYLITRRNKDYGTTKVLTDGKKMLDSLGNPPVMLVSELKTKYHEIFSKATTAAGPGVRRDVLWFNTKNNVTRYRDGYEAAGWRDGWETIDKDEIDYQSPRFCVTLEKSVPQFASSALFDFAESFKHFINNAIAAKIPGVAANEVIYGLPKDSPLKKQSGWIDFPTHVFNEMKKMMTPEKELHLLLKPFSAGSEILNRTLKKLADKKPLDASSSIQKFAIEVHELQKYDAQQTKALSGLVDVAKRLKIYDTTNTVDFEKKWKAVIKEYPLLEFITSYYYGNGSPTKTIIGYLQMVEDAKSKQEDDEVVTLAMNIVNNLDLDKEKDEEAITIN